MSTYTQHCIAYAFSTEKENGAYYELKLDAAAPNALGEARRNKAWFRAKVKNREKSWRAIREDAEDMVDLNSLSVELVIAPDVE